MATRTKLAKADRPISRIESKSKLPRGAIKAGYPGFVAPSLASLRSAPPAGANWLHEIKFDGYRLQANIRPRQVKLLTRSGLDWTARFELSSPALWPICPLRKRSLTVKSSPKVAAGHRIFQPCRMLYRPGARLSSSSRPSISSTWMVMTCDARR